MKLLGKGLLLIVCMLIFASPAYPCSVTTTGLIFANYDVFSPLPLNSTGSVTVECPPRGRPRRPNVTISIGPSTNSGGFIPRQMKHAGLPDLLAYNLYIDSAGTSVWGDGTGGTQTVLLSRVRRSTRRRPRPVVTTIYGIVPPLQNVSIGTYSDLLTVTIVW